MTQQQKERQSKIMKAYWRNRRKREASTIASQTTQTIARDWKALLRHRRAAWRKFKNHNPPATQENGALSKTLMVLRRLLPEEEIVHQMQKRAREALDSMMK